jgi:hypothetical protein
MLRPNKAPSALSYYVNRLLDWVALILFPSRKYLNLTLGAYTVIFAVGMAWYFANWLWAPAVVLSMIMSWMLFEWFF